MILRDFLRGRLSICYDTDDSAGGIDTDKLGEVIADGVAVGIDAANQEAEERAEEKAVEQEEEWNKEWTQMQLDSLSQRIDKLAETLENLEHPSSNSLPESQAEAEVTEVIIEKEKEPEEKQTEEKPVLRESLKFL